MKINAVEFKKQLQKLKPIFGKLGSQYNPEWVLYEGKTLYARNGFFFGELEDPWHPENEVFLFNAIQMLTFIGSAKKDEVLEIEITGQDICKATLGKKVLEFNSPITKDEFFKDYYYPDIDDQDFQEVKGVKESIKLALQTVYEKNIEFSNIYSVSGVIVSSDGNSITTAFAEGMPDTSIPMKTDEVLFFEPSKAKVTNEMVTFVDESDSHTYVVSATKNIGNASALTRIIPKDTPRYTCKPADDFKKIMQTGSRLDQEFKKQDTMIEVKIAENMLKCELRGRKTKYSEAAECEHEVDFVFKVNPIVFIKGLLVSESFLYDPELDFVQFESDDVVRMVAIERV